MSAQSEWPPASKPPNAEQIADQTVIPKIDELAASMEKRPEFVELPKGKELNEEAALNLAKSRPVQWIVLAGPVDSGKTTLLTSLYELFQWRQVEGFAFAGSNTLPAFEERCYLSRRDSGNPIPQTQRTPYKGPDPEYLHLRIRSVEGLRQFRDFLFTDVSGEMFEHARDSTTECKEMIFLKRAHHFLLFLDSAKGVQQDKRWAMIEDNKALLQSCVDSEMIGPNCSVNIIWSRFDYFAAKNTVDQHRDFRVNVEREFREVFGHRIPKLLFSEVAARPLQAPDLLIGHGVSGLLKQWAETPLGMRALELFPSSYLGMRESEIFATRHFSSTRANEKSQS